MTSTTRGGQTQRSWDTVRPVRHFQPFWVSCGVLFTLPGLVATYLRVVPPTDDGPALVASFISYGVLAYLIAFLCFVIALLRARRRGGLAVLTGIVAVLLGCHVAWLAPLFIPDHRMALTPTFTVMNLNMRKGSADPQQVANQANQADVVILLESTPAALQRLKPFGWEQRFPYSVGDRDVHLSDSAIYSRFPLTDTVLLPETAFQQWATTAEVPQLGPVRIIATHPCNPYCGGNRWSAEHARLVSTADANMNLPLVVAGDFNAVDDHGPMRALRREGLESATDLVGAGWLPTYPANRTLPPLLPIDHVLLNHFLTATSTQTFKVADTDHLGLLTTVAGVSSPR
jgi:endonuclease/exonuclease/phosphatase (EEP) superfamily protein YafD